jgi:electron transport complex protein RnfB
VIAEDCTGCELCIAPCPVDCISLVRREAAAPALPLPSPALNRQRFEAHVSRIARRAAEQAALLSERKRAAQAPPRA